MVALAVTALSVLNQEELSVQLDAEYRQVPDLRLEIACVTACFTTLVQTQPSPNCNDTSPTRAMYREDSFDGDIDRTELPHSIFPR
jgi:hypothetical protein